MTLRYKLKTAPIFTPVSVDELKRNLRIEHNDQDDFLYEIVARAVAASQVSTGRQYARATYTLYLDGYPGDSEVGIELGPVSAITSIKYLAQGASELTTLDPSKYQLDNIELTARLRFLESFSVDAEKMNVIEIEFLNGWEAAPKIPEDLRHAIILRASEMYLNPGSVDPGKAIIAATAKEANYKVQRY